MDSYGDHTFFIYNNCLANLTEVRDMTKYFILIILLFMTCIITSYGIFMVPRKSFGVNLARPVTEKLVDKG